MLDVSELSDQELIRLHNELMDDDSSSSYDWTELDAELNYRCEEMGLAWPYGED